MGSEVKILLLAHISDHWVESRFRFRFSYQVVVQ